MLTRIAEMGSRLIVHAEDSDAIDRAEAPHGERYSAFLASRPRGAENLAIAWLLERARWTGANMHVLHLSSSDALPMLASARRAVNVTVETCPHHLTFNSESVPDGATEFECCPPIREAENRERLWDGLTDGIIDIVVSDHSPCTPELKQRETGDFGTAWGGIASLQVGLPAVWSGARVRGRSLARVVEWMAERPAKLAGLAHEGAIALGGGADFCGFAPDAAFVVDVHRLAHRNPVSPYDSRALSGVVRRTWLRGARIDTSGPPAGRLLRRGAR